MNPCLNALLRLVADQHGMCHRRGGDHKGGHCFHINPSRQESIICCYCGLEFYDDGLIWRWNWGDQSKVVTIPRRQSGKRKGGNTNIVRFPKEAKAAF